MSDSDPGAGPVDALAEEFAARYRRGERPSVSEYIARCPEQAERIRRLFPALAVMEEFGSVEGAVAGSSTPPRLLGDYRILREVGRGGMGVVYEAEQVSLGRRVALKVLAARLPADRVTLERFRREARAAAKLHHTNIVPVFEVGRAGGVCYYAMQFIRGQGLDLVIKELARLRRQHRPEGASAPVRAVSAEAAGPEVVSPGGPAVARVVQSLLTGRFAVTPLEGTSPLAGVSPAPGSACAVTGTEASLAGPGRSPAGPDASAAVAPSAEGPADPAADSVVLPGGTQLSTAETGHAHEYHRGVARIGQQAALALAHAHARGVVHRDIKPSNLLLDGSGTVWVTDFGLAKGEEEGLTQTGDLLGTLRYMAPERFRGEGDARADIYALGLTLYELLTLEPAFETSDRLRLIERVKSEEPVRPRVRDRRIPRDLETIVLKAAEKDPRRRYRTADELAEDLRRFLAGETLLARPVGRAERLWRWSRRNPVVAGLGGAVLLLSLIVAAVASAAYLRTKAAEASALRHWYTATMNLVQQAWERGDVLRFRKLLAETAAYPERGFEWYYWRRVSRLEHRALVGHRGGVVVAAFSPNGRWLATGGGDGTARLWDAASGEQIHVLRGHRGEVTDLAFTPDSNRLVTGGADETARVWDLTTLQGPPPGPRILQAHSPVWSVAVTPDGRVLTGTEVGTVQIWDPDSRQCSSTIEAHSGAVWSLAVTPDGKWLVTGSEDGTAKVWDLLGGGEPRTLQGHGGPIPSVAVTPDGQRVVTGGVSAVQVWDIHTGRELLPRIKEPIGGFTAVAVSPDGQRVLTGEAFGAVRLWDLATRRELRTLTGHLFDVCSIAFSPDGNWMVTVGEGGTVQVWDTVGGRGALTLKGHEDPVTSVAVTPNGKWLVTGSEDGTAKIWDMTGGRRPRTIHGGVRAPPDYVDVAAAGTVVAVTPVGERLVTGSRDGTVKVWDLLSGRELLTLAGQGHPVTCVAVTPDGQRVVIGSQDGTVRVWDTASNAEPLLLEGHYPIQSVGVDSDGRRLVIAGGDGTTRLCELPGGRTLLTVQDWNSYLRSATVTPDGRRLVTAGGLGMVKVWDTADGRELLRFKAHSAVIWSVAVTPDGERLVTGSEDGTAKVWDLLGRELLTLQGHAGPISSVAVTADGRRLVTGGADGTARVWEAASPEQVAAWDRQDQEAERHLAAWREPVGTVPGFIRNWLVLAPLPLEADRRRSEALDHEQLAGEARLRPRAGERVVTGGGDRVWEAHRAAEAVLDFNRAVGRYSTDCVAYAVCYVVSDRARDDLFLQVGSDDEAKVYLNGQEVYKYIRPRGLGELDPIGPVALREGTNVLAFKVMNRDGVWGCCARFVDQEGNPAGGLRETLNPGPSSPIRTR